MRKRYFAALALALAAGLAAQSKASIYLNYPNVDGPVTADGFDGDLQLLDFALAESRGVSSPTGGSADREASAPLFSEVSMNTWSSSASVQLWKQAAVGEAEDVKMYITQSMKESQQIYAEWDFDNAMVSSISTSSGGDLPMDHFTLNFTAFTYTWTNFDPLTGDKKGTVRFGYDLATAKASLVEQGDTTGFSLVTAEPEPASAGIFALAVPLLLRRRRRSTAL